MNNLDNYLEQDTGKAAKELRCLYDLKKKQEESIAQGDFSKAKLLGVDILNSLNELEFLRERKKNHDNLRKVAIDLENHGLMVAVVRHGYE
ncbi:hypothetical protein VKA52_12820 [Halobacillus sp. HZG1]|uniref:hypothetical protein n=1 Tax=Halobacillus sp. HZG1 TaxID=3111769 RepID=UPI002DB69B2E|nr:hypothetical protein [Halobacillus sp. HZG1]MEC3884609.1 hypothetical protein [Halobacillus sp. HZG1]